MANENSQKALIQYGKEGETSQATTLTAIGFIVAAGIGGMIMAEVDRRSIARSTAEQSAVFTSLLELNLPADSDEGRYLNMNIAQAILGIPSQSKSRIQSIYDELASETPKVNPDEATEMQNTFLNLRIIAQGFAERIQLFAADLGDKIQDVRNSRAARLIAKKAKQHEKQMPQDIIILATKLRVVFGALLDSQNLSPTQQAALGKTARGVVESFNRGREKRKKAA